MGSIHRLSTTGALVVCLIGSQLAGTAFAREEASPRENLDSSSNAGAVSDDGIETPRPAPETAAPAPFIFTDALFPSPRQVEPAAARVWRPSLDFRVVDARTMMEGGQYGRRGSRGRRNGAVAAVIALGAAASITGGAILVYANRPECSTNQLAGGCGYGTKVVGGAVLSAGLVAMVAGALAWR